MKIFDALQEIGLNATNCVVIGSGILSAHNLRDSNDVDVVTSESVFQKLAQDSRFSKGESYGRNILVDDLFEIGTSWGVLGHDQKLEDLEKESVVIDEVRYITLEFLLRVKEDWIFKGTERPKDVTDVALIKSYLKK